MKKKSENYPAYDDDDDDLQLTEEEIKEELFRRYMEGKLVPVEQRQQLDLSSTSQPPPMDYPLSTFNPYETYDEKRLTPNQQQMRYLLETDDVPKSVGDKLWGLVSRHLQLIDIPDYNKLPKYHRHIRNIIRVSLWERDFKHVKYSDVEQIEFYAGQVLLPKSLDRGERTLLATSIVRQQAEELGERTPVSAQASAASGGLLAGFRNLLGGFRR